MTKVGIYGGTFDPIHNGHLITARFVAEAVVAKKVILVPANRSPLKNSTSASLEDRLEMLKLAVAEDDLFEISDVELRRSPPSYTSPLSPRPPVDPTPGSPPLSLQYQRMVFS